MSLNDLYAAKAIEYLLGLAFLLLFIPFWQYATGGATARAATRAAAWKPVADVFHVPDGVSLHPGHAWARLAANGDVTVGMDDFARQLVGPLRCIEPVPVGTAVVQGEPAWTLKADSKAVQMLSPVNGRVVAVNHELLRDPSAKQDDPYGQWLLKVHAPRPHVDAKQLLQGRAAKQYLAATWDEISAMLSPELGTVMHDGGTPVNGLARGIHEIDWEAIARRFLRS